jgi:hypothetical protein
MPGTLQYRRPSDWSWQGATALLLAIGIFLAEATLCIGEAYKLTRGIELSNAGINLITATLSQLVGATAIYIGGRAFAASDTDTTATTKTSSDPASPDKKAARPAAEPAAGNDDNGGDVDIDVDPEPTKTL